MTRRSRKANRASVAQASSRLRSPETREGVQEFHAKRHLFAVPSDPGGDAAAPEGPAGPWAEAEARAEADLRARRAESAAAVREARMDRQREDRAGTRPYEACKRARQEAFSIPHSPLDFGPRALRRRRALSVSGRLPGGSPHGSGQARSAERAPAADVRRLAVKRCVVVPASGPFSCVVRCSPGAASRGLSRSVYRALTHMNSEF